MKVNLHTHTYLCNHADGTPREYVETAIKNGLSVLGFSDHVPYPFPDGYFSGYRMTVSETEKYYREISALRDEYRDKIKILIGYEAEYYPRHFDAMIKNISRFECDYLILGQHFTANEYDGTHTSCLTDDKSLMTAYAYQLCEAMDTGMFSYVAHPDIIGYRGDGDFYMSEALRICGYAKDRGIPLELNLLGLSENRGYPYTEFWKAAAKTGNKVVVGCDAHNAERVGDPSEINLGGKYLSQFGIIPTEDIKLIKIS